MANNDKLVYVIDTSGKINYVNEAFCQLSGYLESELIGVNQQSLRHQDVPQKVFDEMWQLVQKGHSWHGVIKFVGKDKATFWLDMFITPQYDKGNVVGYQCICHEPKPDYITRAKRIYNAINKGDNWVTFEFTRYHKFIFLTLLTLVCQFFIFMYGGWMASIVTALAAMAPIITFWQDIVPVAVRAQSLQDKYDCISRKVYCGTGTDSIFEFNFGMLRAKVKAILERTGDATIPLTTIVQQVQNDMDISRDSIDRQRHEMMQISVAMGQMSAASNEIAQNTVSTADDVNATKTQCEEARSNIAQTTDSIRSLAREVEQAAASADSLSNEAQNIEGLMTNIESIADQTNLLALNAAIEAARAGENGRGFAVVAEEVRALSFRTQESSKQIQSSLTAMLNTINDWVELMAQNRSQADVCVNAAEHSDSAIEAVYHRIDQIANLAMQIATAAEEQGSVTDDINNNVKAVSDASEANWHQTEAVFSQMAELRACAQDIANLSSTFMPGNK